MKALRIFYNDTGQIIWTHGLEGSGQYPTSQDEDLKELPQGTKCLEIKNVMTIEAFMASDNNRVVAVAGDGTLVVGSSHPVSVKPLSKFQQLELRVAALEKRQQPL